MDPATRSPSQVQPQVGIDTTLLGTTEGLRQLARIVSQPDVHQQSVLAAEQLGLGILASPSRLSDAIDTLGGANSTRLESLQSWIGYRAGKLQRLFRNSTSLLQFFLLHSACKPYYTDSEIGKIIFKMMTENNVLANCPVSLAQLTQLLRYLTAHAETLAPVEIMNEIALKLEDPTISDDLYRRLEPEDVGYMLSSVFEKLRDTSVQVIEIVGIVGGVWFAALFSSLLPEETWVTLHDRVIRGTPGQRLRIGLQCEECHGWKMRVWRGDSNRPPREYVFTATNEDSGSDFSDRVPVAHTKSHFSRIYNMAFGTELSEKAVATIGIVASALARLLRDQGQVHFRMPSCMNRTEQCAMAPICNLLDVSENLSRDHAVSEYGWNGLLSENSEILIQELSQSLSELPMEHRTMVHIRAKIAETCFPNLESIVDDKEGSTQQRHESDYDSDGIEPAVDSKCLVDGVVDHASFVALDMILMSTVRFEVDRSKRYLSIKASTRFEETDLAMNSILSPEGLDIVEFRSLIFYHLLPGVEYFHEKDLVISSDGYVAGMEVLWNSSIAQQDALRVRYAQGYIEKDNILYRSIRESEHACGILVNSKPESVKDIAQVVEIFDLTRRAESELSDPSSMAAARRIAQTLPRSHVLSLNPPRHIPVPLSPLFNFNQTYQLNWSQPLRRFDREKYSFETLISVEETRLVVKHHIKGPSEPVSPLFENADGIRTTKRTPVSWLSSIYVLASSKHVSSQQPTDCSTWDADEAVECALPFSKISVHASSRVVVDSGVESFLFFAAGHISNTTVDPNCPCYDIYIVHGRLKPGLCAAQQGKRPWVLLLWT